MADTSEIVFAWHLLKYFFVVVVVVFLFSFLQSIFFPVSTGEKNSREELQMKNATWEYKEKEAGVSCRDERRNLLTSSYSSKSWMSEGRMKVWKPCRKALICGWIARVILSSVTSCTYSAWQTQKHDKSNHHSLFHNHGESALYSVVLGD